MRGGAVYAACLCCPEAVLLVPCEGPEDPGWEYLWEQGWLCPRDAWRGDVLDDGVEGPATRRVAVETGGYDPAVPTKENA